MSDMEHEIASANARFCDRMNAGDIAGACEVYTEDARILPPGADMVTGRAAIAAFWTGAVEAFGITGVTLDSVVVEQQGPDTAREIGLFSLSGEDGVLDNGKFVVVWKRGTDGTWRWDWDIWNSSQG